MSDSDPSFSSTGRKRPKAPLTQAPQLEGQLGWLAVERSPKGVEVLSIHFGKIRYSTRCGKDRVNTAIIGRTLHYREISNPTSMVLGNTLLVVEPSPLARFHGHQHRR